MLPVRIGFCNFGSHSENRATTAASSGRTATPTTYVPEVVELLQLRGQCNHASPAARTNPAPGHSDTPLPARCSPESDSAPPPPSLYRKGSLRKSRASLPGASDRVPTVPVIAPIERRGKRTRRLHVPPFSGAILLGYGLCTQSARGLQMAQPAPDRNRNQPSELPTPQRPYTSRNIPILLLVVQTALRNRTVQGRIRARAAGRFAPPDRTLSYPRSKNTRIEG
jgi:hypothetical protein